MGLTDDIAPGAELGHFNARRKDLRAAGYVVETNGLVTVTPEGMKAAGEVPPAPSTPAERLALWCDRLPVSGDWQCVAKNYNRRNHNGGGHNWRGLVRKPAEANISKTHHQIPRLSYLVQNKISERGLHFFFDA